MKGSYNSERKIKKRERSLNRRNSKGERRKIWPDIKLKDKLLNRTDLLKIDQITSFLKTGIEQKFNLEKLETKKVIKHIINYILFTL